MLTGVLQLTPSQPLPNAIPAAPRSPTPPVREEWKTLDGQSKLDNVEIQQ
jgi:hypothetical protein